MSTLDFLPATVYKPPSPSAQVRPRRRSLNTIMEDDEESNRGGYKKANEMMDPSIRFNFHRVDCLSPLSDHFPTPRGIHFMPAPRPVSSSISSDADSSPRSSSAPWTRTSFSTDVTDFDDLYDASEDENGSRRKSSLGRSGSLRRSNAKKRLSADSTTSRASLPALVIPNSPKKTGSGENWPSVAAIKLLTSPVPPTPPPKVPMSPAIFSYFQSQEVPSSSAPPSLDGSLTSEQMAAMSAPPTPDIGNESENEESWGTGVQLQPAALETLQALSGGDDLYQQEEQVIELPPDEPVPEMQQVLPPLITNIHRNDSIILSPDQQRSFSSLSRLEIPSPGGFFSTLSANARHTWHLVSNDPDSAHPPSSTTAEHFYKTPWTSAPVETIVEMSETMSDGIPTARPTFSQLHPEFGSRALLTRQDSDETITGASPTGNSPTDEGIIPDEIITNHVKGLSGELQIESISHVDRTVMWLTAQSTFLADLINPTEARDDEVALIRRASTIRIIKKAKAKEQEQAKEESSPEIPNRKIVRFSDVPMVAEIIATPGSEVCPLPKFGRQESTYYRAFQHFLYRTRYRDTFVHRIPRFEAIQCNRVASAATHRAQLLGRYQLSVVPMSAKRRMSANVARGDEFTEEDPEKLKRDREAEALRQMSPATWNVMAVKLLNGGRLILSPVAKRIARLSSMGPKFDGVPRDRARILDLGGQATCDWAWHVAAEFINAKVYTVTTKALRQLSNSNIRGPPNHRQVAVDRLVRLPFKDNQFDLISAREIYTILREQAPNGEDEWNSCLKECMRILKPGGYIEFNIMDSDIVNAGPTGLAKSVEFGFNLRTLGYDPYPTKSWIPRLHKAGFVGIKRAWMVLPMGAKHAPKDVPIVRDSMGMEVKLELEAMVTGHTNEIANITGIVGSWAWEKWLLRTRVQTVGNEGTLEGVQEVIEEGRGCGSGWRVCTGWARKPLR
ncbi:hypothetical protein F5884DRAFT_44474 [Xylogone sp. PMI_703]|nr:hypothetical protein F5884DRAFT_44474 [Xylogone sp. PMI_703]